MDLRPKRGLLLSALAVVFVDYVGVGLIYPFFVTICFSPDYHFLPSNTSAPERGVWLGVLLAMMSLAQLISAPWLGAYSDRVGRKKTLIRSLWLVLGGYLIGVAAVVYESLWTLLLSRAIVGLGSGNASVVNALISDLSTSEEKSSHFAWYSMACGAGFTLGPFLGGKLAGVHWGEISPLTWPFWFAAALIGINLLLVGRFVQDLPAARIVSAIHWRSYVKDFLRYFKISWINTLLFVSLIYCFGWSFFFEFIPITLIQDFAFDSSDIGNYYAFAGGTYALSCALLSLSFFKQFKAEHILFLALLSSGVLMLALFLIDTPVWFWLHTPFLQLSLAALFPTTTSLVSNGVAKKVQGEALGVLQSVQSLAFAACPLLSGVLVGLHYQMPIMIGAFAMFVGGALLGYRLLRRSSSEERLLPTEENSQTD